jgi:hypothetical protein
MPRGRSKQAYGNRTDLNGKVPKAAPTGMPYGESKKLMDAQAAVPMASPEVPPPTPISVTSPIKPVTLDEPTQRPNENIMTGLSTTKSQNPDIIALKSMQGLFEAEALRDDAPDTFREFTRWLRSQ